MSLHNGLDTVAITTAGVFTKTYGLTGQRYINNLFASLGLLEDAPVGGPPPAGGNWWFRTRRRVKGMYKRRG